MTNWRDTGLLAFWVFCPGKAIQLWFLTAMILTDVIWLEIDLWRIWLGW